MEDEINTEVDRPQGFVDRIFVPLLWLLSIVSAVLVTILYHNFGGDQNREAMYTETLMRELKKHQYFLDITMDGYQPQSIDSAIVEYGFKVIQNLEEVATLTPFKQVRDSASAMQERYLQHFPMLRDSIQRLDLQTGDIIVTHNNDLHSELFRKLSVTERKYSHLGVIECRSADSILVYHSVANDLTGVGGIESVRIFEFMPRGDFDVAIYRLKVSREQKESIVHEIRALQSRDVPFDPLFDISDTTKLYCAEMVAFAVNKTLGERLIVPTGMFLNKPIYTIEDCYHFPKAEKIFHREGSVVIE